MLTKTQLKELEKRIRQRFIAFRRDAFGEGTLSSEEINMLKEAGLLRPSVRNFSGDAYTLGKIANAVGAKAARMTYEELMKQAMERPTTQVEHKAINWANEHAGEYIKGIEDDMLKDIRTTTIGETRSALRAVRDGVADSIKNRETVGQLKTKLFDMIDDKSRDWQRVAFTEMNNSIQNGLYDAIREAHGPDQLVYKRPNPDACKHCKRLHLESDGVTPRVFKLSELEDSNIGKKAHEWVPTVGSVHPWCQCQLMVLPDGMGFVKDDMGNVELKMVTEKPKATKIEDVKKSFSDEDEEFYQY